MGKWLKKRWKGLALVASSFLAGLGSGQGVDIPRLVTDLVSILF